VRKKLLFSGFDENIDIAVKFSDPDFLRESNNLAAKGSFHSVTLIFDHLTLNWTALNQV